MIFSLLSVFLWSWVVFDSLPQRLISHSLCFDFGLGFAMMASGEFQLVWWLMGLLSLTVGSVGCGFGGILLWVEFIALHRLVFRGSSSLFFTKCGLFWFWLVLVVLWFDFMTWWVCGSLLWFEFGYVSSFNHGDGCYGWLWLLFIVLDILFYYVECYNKTIDIVCFVKCGVRALTIKMLKKLTQKLF